jgi:hypothetical protein
VTLSPKIPLAERPVWKTRFLNAGTVENFQQLDREVRERHGFVFDDFVRDAWIARSFAEARGLTAVRLCCDGWPDFEVMEKDGAIWKFEATEADDPNRRRDDEYKEIMRKEALGLSVLEHDPVENWLTPLKARNYLTTAVKRKASKRYSVDVSLVIYLIGSSYGVDTAKIEAVFEEAVASVEHTFLSVWVLWNGRLYPLKGTKNL